MNSRIQYLIQHPFEVTLDDVAVLQDEIDRFPYFSTLRTLLMFSLKEHNHVSFSEELKNVSIRIPSRVALFHYLQKEKSEAESKEENSPEEPLRTDPQAIDEGRLVQNETIEKSNEITSGIENRVLPTVSNEVDQVSEQTKATVKSVDLLKSELTFSEWLHVSKSTENENTTPSEKEIKFQLIDEFIEKSPKISPVGKIQDSQPQMTKISDSSEYSDLMTETLAQIYLEQKKYDKAIRAYHILELKYPDKSGKFSEKIKEIEDLRDSK